MRIEIDTTTGNTAEYTALIALLASLGGRLPAVGGPMPEVITRAPPPPPTTDAAEPSEPSDEDDSGPADGSIDPTKADSTGVPWDARIHSTPPSMNKSDGAYRKKRKINEVEFGQIHGELAEAYAAAHPTTGTATSGAESQAGDTAERPTAPPPPADGSAGNTEGNRAPPPPAGGSAPTEPATGAAASAAGAGRFAGFPAFVTAVNAIKPGGIPYLELNTYANTVGIAGGFKDMKDHPNLWDDFYALAGGQ